MSSNETVKQQGYAYVAVNQQLFFIFLPHNSVRVRQTKYKQHKK